MARVSGTLGFIQAAFAQKGGTDSGAAPTNTKVNCGVGEYCSLYNNCPPSRSSFQASPIGAFNPDPSCLSHGEPLYRCYFDESVILDHPVNTSHCVLAGFSMPKVFWKTNHKYQQVDRVLKSLACIERVALD